MYESFAGEANPAGSGSGEGAGERRYSKVKQVPKDRVVGTLEGNWRGEIRWKKAGESVRLAVLSRLTSAGPCAGHTRRHQRLGSERSY